MPTSKNTTGFQKNDALATRTRKSKGKSRSGCVVCKERRVKCDEQHPTCSRCEGQERPCVYDTIKVPKWKAKTSVFCVRGASKFNDRKGTVQVSGVKSEPLDFESNILSFTSAMKPSPETLGYQLSIMPNDELQSFGAQDKRLLDHWENFTSADLLVPQIYWIRDILKLAFTNNFLMHALLTISARHLRKTQTSTSPQIPIDYESLESHHLHHALSDFRSTLPKANFVANQDALIGTAFTLSLYYCSLLDFPKNSYGGHWVEECACSHLKAIIPIASADRHQVRKGAFRYICTPPLFHKNAPALIGPCVVLMEHVESLPPDDPYLDLYIDRVESLTTLLLTTTAKEILTAEEADLNLLWILRYGGFVPTQVLRLADALDPVTMVIYAYWLGAAVHNLQFVGDRWWYWKERPPYIIRTISDYLGPEWADWLQWPNMMLERSCWGKPLEN